jgi:putative acetyltransferase
MLPWRGISRHAGERLSRSGVASLWAESGIKRMEHLRAGSESSINAIMTDSVTIALESPRQDGVVRLLELSDAYAQSLYPAESNHLIDLSNLERENVGFFVTRNDGEIVGCCALVEAGNGSAEIKRMFVDPQARGLGVANKLMDALGALAVEKCLTVIQLETGIHQPEAIGLYRKSGYVEIEPFGSYVDDPLSLFMEKRFA